jgi:hypothetical protein
MALDLKQAALDVITAFNAPYVDNTVTYDALKPHMEYNVVLKRVLHPESVSGADAALHYLNNHMKSRKAHLDNYALQDPVYQDPKDAADPKNATNGQVSGTGDYYDDNDATATPIFFTLGFVRSDGTEQWSLVNSFATPTGTTVPGKGPGKASPAPQWGIK